MNHTLNRRRLGRSVAVGASFLVAVLLSACAEQPASPPAAPASLQPQPAESPADATAEPAQTASADEPTEATPSETTPSEETPPEPAATETAEVTSCDGVNTVAVSEEVTGQARADALMAQWLRDHPESDWVAEEKAKHDLQPPADNSDLLEGGQAEGHAYGNYTEIDLLTWRRETEKAVAEGSRIFHSADELGSTIAVSCDMCHPDASNTHPETYPKFQVQLGRVALLRDMIDWCVENPVRGEHMDLDGPRMRALEAYILAQRKGVEMNYGKH